MQVNPMAIDLTETYVELREDGEANTIPGGEAFWRQLKEAERSSVELDRETAAGIRQVTLHPYTEDWRHWEMHPAGEELVFALSGVIDLILESSDGERVVRLTERKAVLGPRGVWHRAKVVEPGNVLHITAGAGTAHRPVRKLTRE
jgi:hypothetical protein